MSDYTGNKGFKRKRTAEQVFKYVEFKRDNKKGGIDWWVYRNEILIPLLIPYYQDIQRRHGNQGNVWLVEDNLGVHKKAWDSLGDMRVLRAPWMSNSPDLNQIEPIWGYLKDSLWDMRVTSSSESVKELAKGRIRYEMHSEGMRRCAKHHIEGYRDKLAQVQRHEGNNNFRG